MPSKAQLRKGKALVAKMRKRRRNNPRRDVLRAYKFLGFVEDPERGRGSHVMLFHPDHPEVDATVVGRDPSPIYVVDQLLENVDEICKARGK